MSDNWFTSKFSELMASSHISFPTPPPNIHLGPGPIDVFSTKFDDLYPDDVEAAVDGEVVSKDDLKQKLLNLKKRWDPEQVEFQDECATVRRHFVSLLSTDLRLLTRPCAAPGFLRRRRHSSRRTGRFIRHVSLVCSRDRFVS